MAMDTANKRASAMQPRCAWRGLWPIPDGTIGQGDRQQTSFMYSGILPESPSSTSLVGQWVNVMDFRSSNQRIET